MRVAVIIPACDAQATLAAALASLHAQSHPEWQGIIVADDRFDYAGFVAGIGLADPRLHFVSTGLVRSGCHHARNVGLRQVQADFVTWLDADDVLAATRLATLLPVAHQHGAAADNLVCVDAASDAVLSHAMGALAATVALDLPGFFNLHAPLVPLIRIDHVQARAEGVEMSEDVIANIRLIDRIGHLPVLMESSYIYRMRAGSISNSDNSAARFDTAYSDYIARIETGDGFGLSAQGRIAAAAGLRHKQHINHRFAAARRDDPSLEFQAFIARMRAK